MRKSWHVQRSEVVKKVLGALTEDAGPRLVGLVGGSGSGKTTAASYIVRNDQTRQYSCDGLVWLTVNEGANRRLPSLMSQLARMVYEGIGGSVGRPPATSEDGTAYIKQRMEEGHAGKGLRCLLVADNVWESDVVLKLLDTGMSVLLLTRDEQLLEGAQGETVGVHELSMPDAKSVLRKAAELTPGVDLPDEAVDLIELCDRLAMNLAFVGRWSTVRNRRDRNAWSDATEKIRTEIDKVQAGSGIDGRESIHAIRRKALLRAGFEDLAVGSDDTRVPQLYMSLAVMPDGHPFTANDAAVLLCSLTPSAEDVESVGRLLETLERWTVVRLTEGTYHMHDAHTSFARERLRDHEYVRRPAVERWRGYISSLDTLRSSDPFVLNRLWEAVENTGGGSWDDSRPYVAALEVMDESGLLFRQCIAAMGVFQETQEDWGAARNTWSRLLGVETRELGRDHWFVLETLRALAHCAGRLGRAQEAERWKDMVRKHVQLTLARVRSRHADGRETGVDEAQGLHFVGVHISTWAPDRRAEVESLLRRSLAAQEAELVRGGVELAATQHSLGVCLRDAGQLEEAEELLRRCLEIMETILGREDATVANALYSLGVCVRKARRPQEAEGLLIRCLMIQEAKHGREGVGVAITLHELGVCARKAGRLLEAEKFLRRCLVIKETKLGQHCVTVANTLHELGVCARKAYRLDESEGLLRRCLVIKEGTLGRDNVNVAMTLHALGKCVREAERWVEAERLLRRCLVIKEAKLGRDDAGVATTLHTLSKCLRKAGQWEEAEQLFRRYRAIKEAKVVSEE